MEIKRYYKKTAPELNTDGDVVKNAELVLKSGRTMSPQQYKVVAHLPKSDWAANGFKDTDGLDEGDEPVLDYVEVRRVSERQNFTQKFIDRAIREGFMSLVKGMLVLHAKPKDLTFKILRSPGYFCCHDNKSLGGEKECREYIAVNFNGVESPDRQNPSGYRKDNFHACELRGEG